MQLFFNRKYKTTRFWSSWIVRKNFKVYPYFIFHFIFANLINSDRELLELYKKMMKNNLQLREKEQDSQEQDRFGLIMFCISLIFLVFAYGVAVGKYRVFPYKVINKVTSVAEKGLKQFREDTKIELPWYLKRLDSPYPQAILNTNKAYPGLNLLTGFSDKNTKLLIQILDMDGNILHEWDADWKRILPNLEYLPERKIPKSRPGTTIHGIVMMENGDIVFNFSELGLVRLDVNGDVVWSLPYSTHHSVHLHDDGNLWVSGQKFHEKDDVEAISRFPNRKPPIWEYTIIEVSPDGKILNEWSIPEILRQNGYLGLLNLGTLKNWETIVGGDADVLHANDVKPFPSDLEEGFFKRGDIMVSPRNINTVFVFNKETEKIKFVSTGLFVRQHDPDFIDGNTFSVFDNNNSAPKSANPQSRILLISAPENEVEVFFEGTKDTPFFTEVCGKNQWLPNGNVLITDCVNGRAFEVNREGEIVWQYYNYVNEGMVGIVSEVQRLPLKYEQIFRKDK